MKEAGSKSSKISIPRALKIALVIKFAILLFIAYRPTPELIHHYILEDDSFYSLQIARNISLGKGSTFDGVTKTNGYQPLYVWAIVPLIYFLHTDTDRWVHAAMTLLAFFSVLSVIPLYRLISYLTRDNKWASLGAFAWLFFPVLFRRQINGLETAMVGFFLIYSLDIYVREIKQTLPLTSLKSFLKLGALLGLLILCRIDQIFLIAGIATDLIWSRLKIKENIDNGFWTRCFAAGFVCLLVFSPWGAYNIIFFGNVMPQSGEATLMLSKLYLKHEYGQIIPFGAYLDMIIWTFHSASFIHWPVEFLHQTTGIGIKELSSIAILLLICVTLLMCLITSTRRVLRAWLRTTSPLNMSVFIYVVTLFFAYSIFYYATWHHIRYFYPFSLLYTLYIACLGVRLEEQFKISLRLRITVASIAAAIYLAFLVPLLTPNYISIALYDAAIWMNKNLPKGTTVGSMQSGIIGYYSNHRVVAMDGKMRPDALSAIREGQLYCFAMNQRVEYIADVQFVLNCWFYPAAGAPFDPSMLQPIYNNGVVTVYKLE